MSANETYPTPEQWDEWMEHACKAYPESISALVATRVAMGPSAAITAEDIAWAKGVNKQDNTP